MKTLGVTGGIGSGKTTVCRMFEALGARVFYADAEGKRILQEDPGAREEILRAFGPASYDREGRLNRAYLAQQVFGDDEKLARINAIVHPRVYAAFEAARRQAEAEGVPLFVKEAALIFETGGDRHLDAVAVVDAPEEERVRRVMARDGVTPEQVRARMAHQLPPDELRRRADFIIENTGDLAALERQVRQVFRAMTA
ncbi:MAG: dephospho-CoA kinase [Rhodothermaceae bacterium]|nr:MAG: dephospho-CoA kinase [Rhodothermaceae bacterium]